ncbi:MAG TPA: insulinase family protein [Phenylobacterium sp.]|uniref:M16 family metallopeptidase n=1 Tax=Phenylobacterium sp. TaxID=1871053 RepID=UPI002D4F2E1A|nr:insulinase family protein [Phenylobacterium sp.]HZZ68315.1 insulinase family protein [Phenylobacterium sp.]
MRGFQWAALAAACVVAGGAIAQVMPSPNAASVPGVVIGADLLRWDPDIRYGRLANGLRYAVRHNAAPKGAISLRLGVGVGSYDEADDERGVAHFVEHMGFSGTRSFPESRLEATFAPLGVAFGRDHNAATELTQTTYQIDLPAAEAGEVDQAMTWLRDVADGMLFQEAAVAKERGVIQAERATRAGAFGDLRQRMEDFQDATLRANARQPIGTEASIAAMTPARLKAFYDRWYRPDNAVVVLVGDLPLDELEAKVKATFGDWTPRGPAGARAPRTPPTAARGLETLVQTDVHLAAVEAICRVTGPDPLGPEEVKLRTRLLRGVWSTVLQHRIDAAKSRLGAPIVEASIASDARPDSLKTCVEIVPEKGQAARALAMVQAEIRRFAADGPSETEVDSAVEEVRSYVRGAITGLAHASPDQANDILDRALDRMPTLAPREALMAFDVLLEGSRPATVSAAFARDWAGWGPLVVATSPEPLTEATVRAAMAEDKAAPKLAAAAADPTAAKWAYDSFGADGKVVQRTALTAPDFVRLRFANGVILNFRRNKYDGKSVAVRVRFGSGRREIAGDDLLLAQIGADFLKTGGLGRNSYADIAERLRDESWDVKLYIGDDAFFMQGDTNASSLDEELHVLSAYLTDPGFRPSLDGEIATAVDAAYRSYASVPALLLGESMAEAVTPGQPNNLPPRERLMATRNADFARILKPALTGAPLEVTIVGDIDEKTAIAAVATSLGALPPRTGPRPQPKAWFMRFPQTLPDVVRVQHQGNSEQAMLGAYWPLYVATPARRREEYSLLLIAAIMRDQLRHRVREDLGMTYSPDAATRMPDNADQGYLLAVVETRPADAETVLKEVRAMADRLARGEITQSELDAARTPLLSQFQAGEATNDYWASALTFSTGDGQGMRDLLERRQRIGALTVDDLKQAAAQWLSRPPVVILATPATKEARK